MSDWLAAGGTAEELEALAQQAASDHADDGASAAEGGELPGLRDFLSIEAWAERDIPPPDRLLGDLLTTTSRMFLVGCTGLGKTLLALAMGCGIASTEGFLHWRNDRPRRVLIIDGEMPGELIRARSMDALRRAGIKPQPGYVTIYARDMEEKFAKAFPSLGAMPPLNDEGGMQWVLDLVTALGGVDCIIFDNVMSLLSGIQKEEEAWKGVEQLVLKLTSLRIGQLWLDHTGHDRSRQYGSSTKAWKFDAVGIMSELPDDQKNRREVGFQLSFEPPGKARRRTPDNWQDFETTVIRLAQDEWTSEPATGGADGGANAGFGKVAPARQVFYQALVAAITTASGAGRTTLDAWQDECLRRGLIDPPPEGDAKEPWRTRDARFRDFRKAKSELLGARWIAIEDQTVIDLKGRWA